MLKQLVTEQFEIWIDRRCIASAIYDALKEKGIKPTLEDCRELWLRFLQNSLNQGLEDEVLEMQVSQNYEEPE